MDAAVAEAEREAVAGPVILKVSEETARRLLKDARRNHRTAFNSFEPHYCKMCDKPVPMREQQGHLNDHALHLASRARVNRETVARAKADEAEPVRWLAEAADVLKGGP